MPTPSEFIGSLAKIVRNAESQKRISELEAENRELKARLQENIDNPVAPKETGGPLFDARGTPYCPGCYDIDDGKRVRLKHEYENVYKCPKCKEKYKASPKPPLPAPRSYSALDDW